MDMIIINITMSKRCLFLVRLTSTVWLSRFLCISLRIVDLLLAERSRKDHFDLISDVFIISFYLSGYFIPVQAAEVQVFRGMSQLLQLFLELVDALNL